MDISAPDNIGFVFSGTPPEDIGDKVEVTVTAADSSGLNAVDTFSFIVNESADKHINGTPGNNWLFGTQKADRIRGLAGNDRLFGLWGDDVLYGNVGNDWLYGGHGNDKLFGGQGNDRLEAGEGDDLLSGGEGHDHLEGGRGNDIYLFGLGDGWDSIEEDGGEDVLRFGEGIEKDDLKLWRNGKDLTIGIGSSSDRIIIEDWYQEHRLGLNWSYGWGYGWGWNDQRNWIAASKDTHIERIEFSDGTALQENQLQQLVQAMAVFDVSPAGSMYLVHGFSDYSQPMIVPGWGIPSH